MWRLKRPKCEGKAEEKAKVERKRKDRRFGQIIRNLLPVPVMILGLWNCTKAKEPSLGVLYDCQAAVTKGILQHLQRSIAERALDLQS